jgi:uncharacterized protein YjbI with pentapeptide repeats
MPQDFSGQNLRGRSFKGQNLAGANFSYADIRGANFTGANLTGANFSHAQAGLQRRWTIFLILVSLILAGISGFLSAIAGYWIEIFFTPSNIAIFTIGPGVSILIVLAVFFIVTVRQGLGAATGAGAGAAAGAVAVAGAVTVAGAGAVAGAVAVAVAVPGAVAVTGAVAVAVAVAAAVAGAAAVAVAVAVAVAAAAAVAGAGAGAAAVAGAGAGAAAVAALGIYTAWRALAGDEKHAFICTIAVAFAATGGTSFRQANLTDANFTQATLKNTDFRGAILTRTCWHETKKLDLARVGDSILATAAVRDLLITGNGYKKSYPGANLQGANLVGGNLNQANLKEADISQANFREAHLEGANLTRTQAIGTDFTNAYLTGTCLEAWNIDSNTKLEQVDCQYVFLLEYPDAKGNRERRPHDPDQLFEAGDFAKLYQKIMNTVQILLRNGANPEAFKIAFQKLMDENPGITPDSIQGVEKKDNDVLVTIKVPEGADKGKIERDFTEPYKLELQNQAALLAAEIRHNQDMKEIAILAITKNSASNPIFNLTNDLKSESKAMTDSADQSRKIENKDGNVIGNILGDNSTISGTVAQTINQLPDEPKSEQPGIKELLNQLHQAIAAETSLNPEDKAEALAQLQTLAEAGKNPKESATQKTAKTALTMLKGIIFGLPSAAAVVEACNKLLPAIAKLFGI